MKIVDFLRQHLPFLVLFFIGALLLLKGLDNTLFWQDEGHLAVLARRILQFGYPKVWDGHNLLTGMDGLDFNKDYALTWDGWLPYYLVAASFAIFGESTFAGRLPFVLCALATLPLLYGLVIRLTNHRSTAFWSVFFMMSPIMFLLHSRQCRYYALLPLSVAVVFWGIWYLPKRRGVIFTSLGLVLLYYSNLVSFACGYFPLLFLPLIFGWNRSKVKAFLFSSVVVFLLTFPFFFYSHMWSKAGTRAPTLWNQYLGTLLGNFVLLNKFYVPLLLLIIGQWFYSKRPNLKEAQYFRVGMISILVSTLFITFVLGPTARYIYHLFPIAAFLVALILMDLWREYRKATFILFGLILLTHALDYLPFKTVFVFSDYLRRIVPAPVAGALRYVYNEYASVDDEEGPSQMSGINKKLHIPNFWERFWRLEYRSYWDEIMHPFPDNLSYVIQFLREHGKSNDGVYLNVGQFPMLFYYPEVRLVDTMTHPAEMNNVSDPINPSQWQWEAMDWFVPRPFSQTRGPFLTDETFLTLTASKGWKVIKHSLDIPANLWDGNWPERFRLYRTLHGEYPMPQQTTQVVYQVLH